LLRQEFRLKSKARINEVYKRGKSLATAHIVMYYYLVGNDNKHTKVCFSVSKKIGKAVERNKIKRRMRECIKKFMPCLDKRYNLIFIARANIKGISYLDVEKNIMKLLKKAGILLDGKG